MIFTLNSIHQMSQTFLNQRKIFKFVMTYVASTKSENIFSSKLTNSSIATQVVSSFTFPVANLLELLWYFYLLE